MAFLPIGQFFRQAALQFWESRYQSEKPEVAAVMALMGCRRLRKITLTDSADFLLDPAGTDVTTKAIARCLIVQTGAGSPLLNLVAADDDPAIGGDGAGGPCVVPLPASSVTILPFHTRQAWSTGSSTITKLIAGF